MDQAGADGPSVCRHDAAMAYDAATGNVALFGGLGNSGNRLHYLADTWTWDGSTWTKQATAVHPSARSDGSMAYDAATGNVVLFGGTDESIAEPHELADTWTWG